MLPFGRMLSYGNIAPISLQVVDFFMSSAAQPTIFMLLNNGEVWGSALTGNNLGLGDAEPRYGKPYFVMQNVKKMYPHDTGILIITNEDKIMYTGWRRSFDGTVGSWSTFQDITSYYSGINIPNIKKVQVSNNNAFILMQNGDIYGHGFNGNGELGFGDTAPRYVPTLIRSGATDVWMLNSNSIIQTGRSFYGCGDNFYNQLGINGGGPYTTWQQLFKSATDDSSFDINELRVSDTHFILYSTGKTFYANGRNYTGAWGIGNTGVDTKLINYKGTLSFIPGDLKSFFRGRKQIYWTNILLDSTGNLWICGTLNGGGGSNVYTFQPLSIGGANGSAYVCGTSSRSYAVMDCTSGNYMYACGTSSSDPAGFTPLSTPLPHTWSHITDFNFDRGV